MLYVTRFGVDYLRRAVQRRVETEGLRPFSMRTGIPLGQLRSLLQGRAARSTTLERMSSVLGLEFYIGPARKEKLPRAGLPPEIAEVLELPKDAHVADAVGLMAKDLMASQLRKGMGVVRDLVDRAAAAAELLPSLVPGERDAPDARQADTVAIIPFAPHFQLPAGPGEVVFEQSSEMSIAVARDAVASWARPERLTCFRADGDAMEPTVQDGDLIAVDQHRTDPLEDELFAVLIETGLSIKRLHQTAGRWFLVSDNPAYLTRPLGDRDRIVGQLAWCGPHGRDHPSSGSLPYPARRSRPAS